MGVHRRRDGFTLIEAMIVVAIVGVVVGLGALRFAASAADQRAKGAARSIADLLLLARTEAVRTGVNHVVLFQLDPDGAALQNQNGTAVAAVVIRDADGDGKPDAGEAVDSLPFDRTNSLNWGGSFALPPGAEVPPPNDNAAAVYPLPADFECCSFTQPGGAAARWVAFVPDGTPRAYSTGPFAVGAVGSGNGSVYVTSQTRDYAVVLQALGGVRVHAWNRGAGAWRR